MKKFKQTFAWVAMLLTLAVTPVSAYDFEADGIFYLVTSSTDFTCAVVQGDHGVHSYVGDVEIPSTVSFRNKEFHVTGIGGAAFYLQEGLTSVVIPTSVTSIEGYAFRDCDSLVSITIPNSVKKLGYRCFSECDNLTDIILSNTLSTIEYYTFNDCSSLKSIIIPNSVTTIDVNAFRNCRNLEAVTIGDSVKSVGGGTFFNCSRLKSITLPKSVTSIGGEVISGCTSMTSIISLNSTPPTLAENTFTALQYMDITLYVPEEAISAYKEATGWKNFWNIEAVSEETTGIEAAETASEEAPAAIYDLQGRRLDDPQKGVNIIRQTDGKTHTIIRK